MDQRDDWHLTEKLNNPQGRGDPFAAAVRATRMPMVITDPNQPDNPIVFVNEAFQNLSGYSREEIIGRNCRFLQGPETDESEVAKIRRAIESGQPISIDLLNYRKDGSTFWNALHLSPVRGDDGTISFFFASQMDVTERVEAQDRITRQKSLVDREVKRRTAELETALEAKTILLHEVDHRVKNNLNMVGSLLRLQARSSSDPAVAEKLNATLERLEALSAVHRRLYEGGDITHFDIGSYLESLVRDLVRANGRQNLKVTTDLVPMLIASSRASGLGLLLNETLTNAMKHAFIDGRAGELTVRSSVDGQDGRIDIADNGPGFDVNNLPSTGLGYTLMTRLARQAGVTTTFTRLDPGMQVTFTFKLEG